jgi:hypothetical protein
MTAVQVQGQENKRQQLQPPDRLARHQAQPGTKGKRPGNARCMCATSY